MPVRRFRSVEEMEDERWREPGDPQLFAAIAAVWDFAARTCPRRFPPGVHKHRSIVAAWELRDTWEATDFEALWARRR